MTANTYGRQVVIPLVNKSGGALAAGDVVIVDTSNNDAVTTTTSASSTTVVGIVQETIASNATGRVLLSGYAALVNVPSSVTRGHYAFTHTVAKQATGSASRAAGAFGQFLTGGTTPDAHIFGITDSSVSGLTNPLTTTGDTIYSSSGSTAARRAIGSTGDVYTVAGGVPTWAAPAGVSFSTVDATLGADVTMTTAGTYYDGPSGSFSAGTWLIWWKASFVIASSLLTDFVGRLWDGSTIYDETAVVSPALATVNVFCAGFAKVTLGGTTTLKISGTADRNSETMARDVATSSGSSHTATRLTGLKIA